MTRDIIVGHTPPMRTPIISWITRALDTNLRSSTVMGRAGLCFVVYSGGSIEHHRVPPGQGNPQFDDDALHLHQPIAYKYGGRLE